MKRFAGIAVLSMMLTTVLVPHAFARTASSAVSEIEDAETAVKALKNNADYNASNDFATDDDIENYFEELTSVTEDVEAAIKTTNRPITQVDFDKVESAYDDFESAVKADLRRVDQYLSSGSDLQETFDDARDSYEDDDALDDAKKALDALNPSATSTTTTSTTSAKVESAVEDIDSAYDDVKGLRTDIADMEDSTDVDGDLEQVFDDLVAAAENVIDALKTLTGTFSSSEFEEVNDSVLAFNKEVQKRFDQFDDLTGSGAALDDIRDDYLDLRNDYRDGERDDINEQMDRIRKIVFGSAGGSSIITATVTEIEDIESDVEGWEQDEAAGVLTDDDLGDYFDEIIQWVEDATDEVKKNSGTITQADFDELEEAVSNLKSTVISARNAVRDNEDSADFEDEYDNQKDDLDEAIDDLETALDEVEKNIGTVTPPTTGGNTTFSDVPATSEFARYIAALASRSVVTGYSDGTFHPKLNVTRAEFLKMALRAANKNTTQYQNAASTFQDVVMGHSLRPYINYASANGIVNGMTVGGVRYFYPERPISRAEAVIILMRINMISPAASGTTTFTDVRDTEQGRYISVAASRGIINGYNATSFGPNDFLTREQAAKIVARIAGFVQ